MASTFLYGTYGLQHAAWANRIAACRGMAIQTVSAGGATVMSGLPDDFEKQAREVLEAEDPKLLTDLLALRAEVNRFTAQAWPGSPPSADALNARNQHLLDEAARLLGPDKAKAVFGYSPEQPINLVDPNIRHSPGSDQSGAPLRPERSR